MEGGREKMERWKQGKRVMECLKLPALVGQPNKSIVIRIFQRTPLNSMLQFILLVEGSSNLITMPVQYNAVQCSDIWFGQLQLQRAVIHACHACACSKAEGETQFWLDPRTKHPAKCPHVYIAVTYLLIVNAVPLCLVA